MIVVLCRVSDVAPPDDERQRWVEFFAAEGRDPSNVARYLTEVSLGKFDAADIMITDWLDIGHTADNVGALVGIPQREAVGGWCRETAASAGIDLASHGQVVYGLNINCDHGGLNGRETLLAYFAGRSFEPTFMFHEVGHALGLGHSRSQVDGEYGDRFDIMSAMNVWTYKDEWGRDAGPGMTALNLEKLGWLDDSVLYDGGYFYDRDRRQTSSQEVVLAPLDSRAIEPNTWRSAFIREYEEGGQTYHIEYRRPSAWDLGVPGARVLVHVLGPDGTPTLIGGGAAPSGALTEGTSFDIGLEPYPAAIRFDSIDARSTAHVIIEIPETI